MEICSNLKLKEFKENELCESVHLLTQVLCKVKIHTVYVKYHLSLEFGEMTILYRLAVGLRQWFPNFLL